MIVLGDARGHETGKQGNRFVKPGHEKLPTLRAIGSGRIDTEVCDVTAGASSPAKRQHQAALTRTVSPTSRTDMLRAARDLQPIPAIRHNHGGGINNNGDGFRLGIIPTTTTTA